MHRAAGVASLTRVATANNTGARARIDRRATPSLISRGPFSRQGAEVSPRPADAPGATSHSTRRESDVP